MYNKKARYFEVKVHVIYSPYFDYFNRLSEKHLFLFSSEYMANREYNYC